MGALQGWLGGWVLSMTGGVGWEGLAGVGVHEFAESGHQLNPMQPIALLLPVDMKWTWLERVCLVAFC